MSRVWRFGFSPEELDKSDGHREDQACFDEKGERKANARVGFLLRDGRAEQKSVGDGLAVKASVEEVVAAGEQHTSS
jgi:hypothetical protein